MISVPADLLIAALLGLCLYGSLPMIRRARARRKERRRKRDRARREWEALSRRSRDEWSRKP